MCSLFVFPMCKLCRVVCIVWSILFFLTKIVCSILDSCETDQFSWLSDQGNGMSDMCSFNYEELLRLEQIERS